MIAITAITLQQSYGAFNHILGDFSIIINQFEALSAFSAGLTRLTTFLEKIEEGGWGDLPPSPLSFREGESEQEQREKKEEGDSGAPAVSRKPVFSLKKMQSSLTDSGVILSVKNLTVLTPDAGNEETAADLILICYSDSISMTIFMYSPYWNCCGCWALVMEVPLTSILHSIFYLCRVGRILVGAIRPNAAEQAPISAAAAASETGGFRGVDFELRRGDRVLVVGPSGAGKRYVRISVSSSNATSH
jgi:ABC-type uncharacterized transport system fused permease/ATPase subunit